MLRFEPYLPSLPVPPLSHTLPLYLSTLSPHLTAEELAVSKRAVDKFSTSELAQTLQSRLEHRAKAEGRDSWLAEWWDEVAYMSYRCVPPWPELNLAHDLTPDSLYRRVSAAIRSSLTSITSTRTGAPAARARRRRAAQQSSSGRPTSSATSSSRASSLVALTTAP
jgi:hypothetical protein